MSVINQMLKDLDKRQENAPTNQGQVPVVVNTSQNSSLVVIVTIVITLAIVASVYLWFENQSLKQGVNAQTPSNSKANSNVNESNTQNAVAKIEEKRVLTTAAEAEVKAELKAEEVIETEAVASEDKNLETAEERIQASAEVIQVAKTVESVTKPSANNATENQSQNLSENTVAKNTAETKAIEKPVLSISRKQLSPKQLSAKKMRQAEDAILDNDVEKAEKLLEEVLLVMPENNAARKQLAALWYGRKLMQPALNVLAQGLAISPQEHEFRLMQAKILVDVQRREQALTNLLEQKDVQHVEYQTLVANLAQQLDKSDVAIAAYKKLVQLEPYQGRWQLAQAVAYDKQAQYQEAVVAYKKAIELGGLSDGAMTFARQRYQELGEQ